jgi:hypothetical protein
MGTDISPFRRFVKSDTFFDIGGLWLAVNRVFNTLFFMCYLR